MDIIKVTIIIYSNFSQKAQKLHENETMSLSYDYFNGSNNETDVCIRGSQLQSYDCVSAKSVVAVAVSSLSACYTLFCALV